jgi:hypothetical protein
MEIHLAQPNPAYADQATSKRHPSRQWLVFHFHSAPRSAPPQSKKILKSSKRRDKKDLQ